MNVYAPTLRRLRDLLFRRDEGNLAWGIELLRSLGDPALFDRLLRGVTWEARANDLGTLRVRGFFHNARDRRRWDITLVLATLAVAPPESQEAARLIASVTSLALDRPYTPLPGERLDLAPLRALVYLQSLRVRASQRPLDLAPLAALPRLASLSLECPVDDLSGLRGASALAWLSVASPALERPVAVAPLPALCTLDLVACPNLRALDVLEGLDALASLALNGRSLPEGVFVALGRRPALRNVRLSQGASLRDDDAATLATLDELRLEFCAWPLASVPAPSRLRHFFASAPHLRTLEGLASPSLERLTLTECGALTSLAHLTGAPRLRALKLTGCTALTSLEGLERCDALEHCTITAAPFRDVRSLASLPALTTLSFEKCAGVTGVRALASLPALCQLDLTGTSVDIASLPPLLRVVATADAHVAPEALDARAPLRSHPAPPELAQTTRPHWSRVLRLLLARDTTLVSRGVALTRVLDDPCLYDVLLRGVTWRPTRTEWDSTAPQVEGTVLDVPGRDEVFSVRTVLALAAAAPPECLPARALRESLTCLCERLAAKPGDDLSFDAAPLRAFTALRTLRLRSRVVSSVETLATLTGLRELDLDASAFPAAFDLSKLQCLEVLRLSNPTGDTLARVQTLPHLRELGLQNTPWAGTLRGCPTLTRFDWAGGSLTDADGTIDLRDCPALTWASLHWVEKAKRVDVTGCPSLRRLSLMGTARDLVVTGASAHSEIVRM